MGKVRLREIAYARSGDKGSSANIGVIVRRPEDYVPLGAVLTAAVVQNFFRAAGVGNVTRFELQNLGAYNFLLPGILAGGGSLSLRIDPQGKALGQTLLEIELDWPEATLPLNSTVLHLERPKPEIVVLTLNRPEKRNALHLQLLEQLAATVEELEHDTRARVIVLRGAGPSFCAGMDLQEASDPEKATLLARGVARLLLALGNSRLVTLASVHGAALAGGAGLVAACDLAVGAEGMQWGFPEVRRGLVASLVMTFVRRQLGDRWARALFLLGDSIDGPQSLTLGIIQQLVPLAHLERTTLELANRVCRGAPGAITRTKKLLDDLGARSLADDLQVALAHHLEARHAPEAAEGIAAFLAGRSPRWDHTEKS